MTDDDIVKRREYRRKLYADGRITHYKDWAEDRKRKWRTYCRNRYVPVAQLTPKEKEARNNYAREYQRKRKGKQ